MKRLALLTAPLLFACGNNQQEAPPPRYAAPPVAITSAPPPTPAPPPPPPPGGGEGHMGPGPSGMHHPPGPGPMHEMREQGHVYRFDFSLTAKEGATAQPPASFTIILLEGNHGEVLVGKNVPLQVSSTLPNMTSPRQDVGIKVKAQYRTLGDDVLLEVSTEMSAQEGGGAIRKVTAQGNALASAGKPSLVVALDDDKKHYELTVTPTKLR
ncbi:MAG TPA: hypothetical protein VIF62_39495 [Labilithrix sp.]